MTASSPDALSRAVVELARRENLLSWETIRANLNAEHFASAKIENARSTLLRTYLQAHQEYAESLLRGQPLSPISIPDSSPLNAALHPDNSPSQASTSTSDPVDLPSSIFMFVGDILDTMSCEHDPDNDESFICKDAVEQRWFEHYAVGKSIILSWKKKDCNRTYRTPFVVVHDHTMQCDIKFGVKWLRGAPLQEKPQERKRKTTLDEYDDIERPWSKRQNHLKPEELDIASVMIGKAVHTYIRSSQEVSARYQHSPHSSSERIPDTDGDWAIMNNFDREKT